MARTITALDLVDAMTELLRATAAADDTTLAAWARKWGADLVTTVVAVDRDKSRHETVARLLTDAAGSGAKFFLEMSQLFLTLSPGRVHSAIEKAAKEHGPSLVGKLAAAQAAYLVDGTEQRQAKAHEILEQFIPKTSASELLDAIADDALKVT